MPPSFDLCHPDGVVGRGSFINLGDQVDGWPAIRKMKKKKKLIYRTDPVILLCCAVASQEGWFDGPGAVPVDRNNPGDIRFAGQLNASAPGWDGTGAPPIATFTSAATGITGLFRQIWLQIAEGQTVAQIIAQWAPVNQNNTSQYLQDVLQWTGLQADVPMLEQIAPLVKLG